mmetsp:Transcript_1891/g.4213  ORF Transcript_1891/g.4213 Transcript_1891/m.4213 type:complete len:238 (-) Transcript_1891:6-719(-)
MRHLLVLGVHRVPLALECSHQLASLRGRHLDQLLSRLLHSALRAAHLHDIRIDHIVLSPDLLLDLTEVLRHLAVVGLGQIVRLSFAEALRDLEDGLDGVRRDEILRSLNAHHRTVLDLRHRRLPACVTVLERGWGRELERSTALQVSLRVGVGLVRWAERGGTPLLHDAGPVELRRAVCAEGRASDGGRWIVLRPVHGRLWLLHVLLRHEVVNALAGHGAGPCGLRAGRTGRHRQER